MRSYHLDEIKSLIQLDNDFDKLIAGQKRAFRAYSLDEMEMPLPLQLHFPEVEGDCHVKAGYQHQGNIFVIKVATGFYQNHQNGLPVGDGVILIFSKKTGLLLCTLYDQGYLTTLRTALAAIVAAQVTPWPLKEIGVIGTGQVAQTFFQFIERAYPQAGRNIWGRSYERACGISTKLGDINVCRTVEDLLLKVDLVVTTTASHEAIVKSEAVSEKTHIIALGADEKGKQELDPRLFKLADLVLVDSKKQAASFGDISHAIQKGLFEVEQAQELGNFKPEIIPNNPNLIITDLTGIAVQDLVISEYVLQKGGLC